MNIANMYDELIAESYDYDQFELLSKSRHLVVSQLKNQSVTGSIHSILDMALGTGEILLEIKELYPDADLYGIDISKNMIEIAKKKMAITTFHDDVNNVLNYIEPNRIDLVLIHFILSYVEPEKILTDAAKILHPGGLCSIATSTYESFQVMQSLAQNFMSIEDIKKMAQVPATPTALKNLLKMVGLEILDHVTLQEKVRFADFSELYNWGLKSGWLTQYFSVLTQAQIDTISQTPGIFPLEDEFRGTILLTKKI